MSIRILCKEGGNVEEKILEILTEVNDEIANYDGDNMFDAGLLDSLQTVELISELEEAFDVEIEADCLVEENFKSKEAIANMMKSILN